MITTFSHYSPFVYANKYVTSYSNNVKANEIEKKIHVFKNKNGEIIKEFTDKLNDYYGQRNILIIGCSNNTPQVKDMSEEFQGIIKTLINRGYNVITGAGKDGIMGEAINGSYDALRNQKYKNYKGQSLSIVTQGGWGDEDLFKTTPISMAPSGKESERIELFNNLLSNPHSGAFVSKPGCTTLQEMYTLIAMNKYREKGTAPKRIFLLGEKEFKPVKMQFKSMYEDQRYPVNPYDKKAQGHLFEIIEPSKILQKFPDMQEAFNEEIRKHTKHYLNLPQESSQKELEKAYNNFVKKADNNQKIGLYLYVKKDSQTQKDREIEGKAILQMVNSADGELYPLAVNSGLYQIQQACKNKKMGWES